MLACVHTSFAGEGGPPPPNAEGIAVLFSTGTINFKPIKFKVDNVDKVLSIEWVNKPATISDLFYSFKTDDGVNYRLEGYPAYKGISDVQLTSVELIINAENGASTNLSIPVVVTSDLAPVVAITSQGPIQYNKGQHSQIAMQLNDPGRNITQLRAKLYVQGDIQTNIATIGSRRWGEYVGFIEYVDFDWNWFQNEAFKSKGKTDSDLINYRLPLYLDPSINTGSYDLRVEATDSAGNVTLSDPVSITLTAPVSPPRLILTAPDYRIPAGESYKILFDIEHLDLLERIEFEQTGVVGDPVTKLISFANNTFTQSGDVEFSIPEGALEGQAYTVAVTVYDVSGSSNTTNIQIDVGLWGERTVDITSSANSNDSMRFANVNVTNNAYFVHFDHGIKFNNLTIDTGSSMVMSSGTLSINDTLTVNGFLSVIIKDSYSHLPEYKIRGGQHGGDTPVTTNVDNNGFAYGDYRNPKYPGSNYGSSQYTGGELNIIAGKLNVMSTGVINAKGAY